MGFRIKVFIICLILLFPVTVFGNGPLPSIMIAMVSPANPTTPSIKPSVETCGAGTPTLLLYWPCTSATVTDGGGCSQGDTSATLTNEATIDSETVSITDGSSNGADYYTLSTSNFDIFPQGDFTVQFKLYVTSATNAAYIFDEYTSADTKTIITIRNDGTYDIKLFRKVDNVTVVDKTFQTNFSLSTWYYIVIRCSTTNGPDLWLSTTKWPDVDTGGSWDEQNDVLTNYVDTTGSMRVGNAAAIAAVFKLDDLKVYGGWKTY